ncbi:hypothetical protein, partial [Acidithiobacillus ferridurans]
MRVSLSPLALFSYVWLLQIACFSVGVSYILLRLQDLSVLQMAIFPISWVAFALGTLFIRVLPRKKGAAKPVRILLANDGYYYVAYQIRKHIKLILLLGLTVVVYNYFMFGYPPFVDLVFGITSNYTYMNYGSFKNIIFSVFMLAPLLALYDKDNSYKYGVAIISFGILMLYSARGPIIQGILQLILVGAIKNRGKITFKNFLIVLLSAVIIIFVMGWIGALRTGTNTMYTALLIR